MQLTELAKPEALREAARSIDLVGGIPALISTLLARFGLVREFVLLFLCVDAVLIAAHALHAFTPHLPDFYSNITYERGAAETVQFLKETWIFLGLGWVAIRVTPVFGAWALFFGYVLLDDTMQIHEQAGEQIVEWLGFTDALGIRAVDFGELTVFLIAGAILFPIVGLAFYLGGRTFRVASLHLLGLLAGLAVFSIIIDAIHGGTNDEFGHHPMALLEEGGELIITSMLCCYVLSLIRKADLPDKHAFAHAEGRAAGAIAGPTERV